MLKTRQSVYANHSPSLNGQTLVSSTSRSIEPIMHSFTFINKSVHRIEALYRGFVRPGYYELIRYGCWFERVFGVLSNNFFNFFYYSLKSWALLFRILSDCLSFWAVPGQFM